MDDSVFDSVFWITITGLVVSFLLGIINTCLKSKCRRCALCFGLIQITRDTEAEIQEEKNEIDNHINPYAIERII
jgi:hypothetical protein